MDINNFSDQDLIDLKNKQDEKLVRYLKCYNEATERTIKRIFSINLEINRRALDKEKEEAQSKINKSFNPYSKEFKETYTKYCNYDD